MKTLWQEYGIFAPKYFFNPNYKLKRWDGKKRFFSETGITFITLLPEIIEFLQQQGYTSFAVRDKRKKFEIELEHITADYFSHKQITLADHQVAAINALFDNYGGVLRAGTGAGKTIITAALCDKFNQKNLNAIVIVPNYDLVLQTVAAFQRCGVDVGEFSGKKKDVEHANVISTWQALQNNSDVLKLFNVLILDECQGIGGNVLQKLITEDGKHMPIRIGMTATIPDDECNRLTLKCNIGDIVYEVTAGELIEKGWLSDVHINCITLKEDLTYEYKKFKRDNPEADISYAEYFDGYFPDFASEMGYCVKSENRNLKISELVTNCIDNTGNVLIILNSVKHGKHLEHLIPGSVFVYGSTKTKDRTRTYASYKDNDNIIMISTYKLVQAGLDVPRIYNLFLIDAGKSFVRTVQSIGRGLRKAEDKVHIEVFDIHSNFKYSTEHLKERIKHYKAEKFPYSKVSVNLPPVTRPIIDSAIDFD
jgi:superfamily II DNA or RNA helicase